MNDTQFVRAFEAGAIAPGAFHHREHLRLAWTYLRESPSTAIACERMGSAIRAFASAAGHPAKYHETLTVFWVRLLAEVRDGAPDGADLQTVLEAHPYLLDKATPHAFYTHELIMSDAARRTWCAPDLRALDAVTLAKDGAHVAGEAHTAPPAR